MGAAAQLLHADADRWVSAGGVLAAHTWIACGRVGEWVPGWVGGRGCEAIGYCQ